MTCLEFRMLLDRYIDGELSADQRANADAHLNDCITCRDELASLQSTRQALATTRPETEPHLGYWDDSRERIIARTVLSDAPNEAKRAPALSGSAYSPLLRSVLSVAASVALLVGVLVVGSKHEQPAVVIHGPEGQIIVAQALADELLVSEGEVLSIGDQRRIGTACILAGGPGMVGRFNCLPGLLRVY